MTDLELAVVDLQHGRVDAASDPGGRNTCRTDNWCIGLRHYEIRRTLRILFLFPNIDQQVSKTASRDDRVERALT